MRLTADQAQRLVVVLQDSLHFGLIRGSDGVKEIGSFLCNIQQRTALLNEILSQQPTEPVELENPSAGPRE